MARLPRFFVPGQPLHIIQRGNNREPIFASDDDYRFYLECLQDAADAQGLVIHAYVLMTNHVHLLASPESETSPPKTLQSVGRRYVQYFNHTYDRTGTLWEGRYKATLIDAESYLLTCMRYIEMNPVRAAMVDDPAHYRWASYRANALGQASDLLVPHLLYLGLGGDDAARRQAYRALFLPHLELSAIDDIRLALNQSQPLGDSRFHGMIERAVGERRANGDQGRAAHRAVVVRHVTPSRRRREGRPRRVRRRPAPAGHGGERPPTSRPSRAPRRRRRAA